MSQLYNRNPDNAFSDAIAAGVLSTVAASANYTGRYMYMYSKRDGFHVIDSVSCQ